MLVYAITGPVSSYHSLTYHSDRLSCEFAMAEFAERYQPYTDDIGYALICIEREEWERRADTEAGP